jgi:hypothetical protein
MKVRALFAPMKVRALFAPMKFGRWFAPLELRALAKRLFALEDDPTADDCHGHACVAYPGRRD